MPVGPGRREFAEKAIASVYAGTRLPRACVIVFDGLSDDNDLCPSQPSMIIDDVPKHEPGREQPRNVGVRLLLRYFPECTHVWFVDSDVILAPTALEEYERTWSKFQQDDPIMIGPYEWMPPGHREPIEGLRNDPRWAFLDGGAGRLHDDMNAGLACFSGNLVWPIDKFIEVGGFWNEIHHGRCEDGELGLRAVASGLKFTPVPQARGWHMDHPRNLQRIYEMNARDVPMINERHPWVERYGVFVAKRDGKRFEQRCYTCGAIVNTIDWWNHQDAHSA